VPTGVNASKYTNYIVMIVKDRVPITIEDWKLINAYDPDLKNKMWNEIKV